MIVAVNPSGHEFDETLRTLKYSAVARELVHTQRRSSVMQKSTLPATYDQNGRLRKRKRASVVELEGNESVRAAPPSTSRHRSEALQSANEQSEVGTKKKHSENALASDIPIVKVETVSIATSPMESMRERDQRDLRWVRAVGPIAEA